MEHPDEQQRRNQAEFLRNCPPDQRVFHTQMFRTGNAAIHYHRQAQNEDLTEEDFENWLDGLPPNIRKHKEAEGFAKYKTHVPFTGPRWRAM